MKTRAEELNTTIWGIPRGPFFLVLKGLGIFIAWRALYELVLKPSGTPDEQLTRALMEATAIVMRMFFDNITLQSTELYIGPMSAISFTHSCNGLEVMVLYLGFLFVYPGSARRRLIYALLGIVTICVLNVARCTGLAIWAYSAWPLWDIMHHYIFKIIIYGFIFLLWTRYCQTDVRKAG